MKIPFLSFLLLISSFHLQAQTTPTALWQSAEFVKNVDNKGSRVTFDGFGNVYMITTQNDDNPFGGFTLVKYDTLGNQCWQQHHPIEGFGHIYGGFVVDSLGYSYVSLIFNGGTPEYDANTKVLKYSPDGAKTWENANYRAGHSGDNYIYYMARDSSGRLFVLGNNESQTNGDDNFLFVSEIDTSDGHELWRSAFPGTHWLQGIKVWNENQLEILATRYAGGMKYYDIIQMDKQGQMLHYSSNSYSGYPLDFHLISNTGDIITGNRGFGYTLTKVNIEGDTLWRYALLEGILGDKVLAIKEDDSLNVYVTGSWNDANFNRQILTSKFSESGELIWQKSYDYLDTTLFDGGQDLDIDENWVYVVGTSDGGDSKTLMTIIIYDRVSGEEQYILNLERGPSLNAQQILVQGNKFIYTGISHMNTVNSSEVVTGCFRMPDITSASWQALPGQQVEVFPNPFVQDLYVRNIDLQVFKYMELFDIQGRLLLSKLLSSEEEHLLLNEVKYEGALTLVLRGEGVMLSKKIIRH